MKGEINMKTGLFEIALGRKKGIDECDNWSTKTVLAKTAIDAIKKIRLKDGEFIVEVRLLGRES
jgi:hypothetical protein